MNLRCLQCLPPLLHDAIAGVISAIASSIAREVRQKYFPELRVPPCAIDRGYLSFLRFRRARGADYRSSIYLLSIGARLTNCNRVAFTPPTISEKDRSSVDTSGVINFALLRI